MDIESRPAYWAATARPFMLGPLDGTAVFPILLFMLHIRTWTLVVLSLFLVFLAVVRHYGVTLPVMARYALTAVGGRRVRRLPGCGFSVFQR
jgi:intracellular multiplication protein IcmT